jgi:polygalacturonase
MPSTRRQFLSNGLVTAGAVVARGALTTGADSTPSTGVWSRADRVVRETQRPRIPHRDARLPSYGAIGEGTMDCTDAFASAIADLAERGGGRLIVPPGRWLTGAIHLDSNIDLHLVSGATIAFRTDPEAYLPVVYTRDGGIECMNWSPFIYAYGKHDIAITGDGVLDGQASNQFWWPWAGKTQFGWLPGMPTGAADGTLLAAMADEGLPVADRVFGDGHCLRPQFIQPYKCERVLISGVTLHNTPNWQMNPVLCQHVTIENVTASSLGPNNDGCDPECCDHVVIQGCVFRTGDDCIAVKAGKNADGRRVNVPSQHIVIQDCEFLAGHGAVTIGSEMSGGVRHLYARDSTAVSPTLSDFLRLKTNSARGGFIEDIHVRDVTVDQLTDSAVLIDFSYGEGAGYGYDPTVRDIHVEKLTVGTANYPLYAIGYPEDHIVDVSITDTVVRQATHNSVVRLCDDIVLRNVTVNDVLSGVDLPATFDNSATRNFDGRGHAYTADSLAAAGLAPGSTVTHDGVTFSWPSAMPDNVTTDAQSVTLTGSGTRLAVLGAATWARQAGTFTVTYTDGTTSAVVIALPDWWAPGTRDAGAPVATVSSNAGHPVGVYYAAADLAAGRTPATVTLPANPKLHLFAIALG